MKYIRKSAEPGELSEFKKRYGKARDSLWGKISDESNRHVKEILHESLMAEQGHICCYCEQYITKDKSHIEHIMPRSNYPDEVVDYDNLTASCGQIFGEHCGHFKGNWYDPALFVSPLHSECEKRFMYKASGEIFPYDEHDRAARETIEKLGLNHPRLRASRRSAFRGIISGIEKFSHGEIQQLIDCYENRDPINRFQPFCTAVLYHLRQFFVD